MSTLLTYAINTIPNPLTAGTSDGVLMLTATNTSNSPISIQGIIVAIPIGPDDDKLTNKPTQIQHSLPANWTANTNNAAGLLKLVFTPSSSPASIPAGNSIVFTLSNIDIENQGSVNIVITEGSSNDPTQLLTIDKFPGGWGLVDFWASQPNLPSPGNDTLSWHGPAGATYTIQYLDLSSGKIINLPGIGQPAYSNSGSWPGPSDPPLTVNATTTFTLFVSEQIGGTLFQTAAQQTIQVAEIPSITCFSGKMTGTPINQQLFVEWTSSPNTDHVLNSWDNRIFPPNAKVAQPVNPPYQPLYSLVPVSSTGVNGPAANLNLNWAVISSFNTGQISGPSTFTPDNKYAFVCNGSSSSVMVINMTTLVTSTIVVGNNPDSIAATPDGKYVLVGSVGQGFGYSAMYVIQISSMTVIQTISMGMPGSIVITADSSTAYVVDYDNRVIQIINLINFSLAAQIPVGLNPGQIVITSDGNTLLIANGVDVTGDNTLDIINIHNNTVIKSLTLGGGPGGIAVSPDNKYAFVSNQNDSTISMIDLIQLSIAKTFTIAGSPSGVAVTNDNKLALVCNSGNAVTVIDIDSMSPLPSVTVGSNPGPICMTHDGLYAFVLNENDSTVSQIELSSMKVIQTIPAGGTFTNYLSMSVDGKFIVVTAAGPVYILGTDVIGNNPDCIKNVNEITA